MRKNGLAELRTRIDAVDKAILSALGKRAQLSRKVGRLKKAEGLGVTDAKRFKDLLQKRIATGTAKGLSPDFVRHLFKLIHTESKRLQQYR